MGRIRRLLGRVFIALYRSGARATAKGFSLGVGGAFARFGDRTVVQPPVRVTGERWIDIGSDVFIGPGSWLQVLGTDHAEPAIVVGDGTSIVGSCVLSAAASLRLGQRVLFARNVYVSDHMHAYDDPSRAVLDQGVTRIAPVEIADGAWLGQNVVVGPGVRIGRGAVIGANSVVLEDIPDHAVAVGAPARVVRTLPAEFALAR
jgi:carbonic anhydrase/acetyltransferase-like protein (isoleucine patch superfamily)